MKFVNKNYYEILDVAPSASEDDIKRAYRLVRGTWKPDSIAVYSLYTPDESEAINHKVEEAFQILSHPDRRAGYDRYLKLSYRPLPSPSTPAEFWDYVHQDPNQVPARAEGDPELLDDVTDLLAEAPPEREEFDPVIEAVAGEGRFGDRYFGGDAPELESEEAVPDRSSLQERIRTRPAASTHFPAETASTPRQASAGYRSGTAPREPRPAVPAAPPAPPPKGGSLAWKPPAPARAEGSGAASGRPPSQTSRTATDPRNPHRDSSTATPSGGTGKDRKSGGQAQEGSAVQTPVADGWSRSYSRVIKTSRTLPDRAVSTQMLAELESSQGLGGAFLRQVREYKGISLGDICERTKIQTGYLKYLEEERYRELPAAVYVEGFVSQVARLLKLDVDHVVAGYMARYHQPSQRDPDEP